MNGASHARVNGRRSYKPFSGTAGTGRVPGPPGARRVPGTILCRRNRQRLGRVTRSGPRPLPRAARAGRRGRAGSPRDGQPLPMPGSGPRVRQTPADLRRLQPCDRCGPRAQTADAFRRFRRRHGLVADADRVDRHRRGLLDGRARVGPHLPLQPGGWKKGRAAPCSIPLQFTQTAWLGDRYVAACGEDGLQFYSPATDTWNWRTITPGSSPLTSRESSAIVWTGTDLIAWSRSVDRRNNPNPTPATAPRSR